jgi:hypothetical protein
MSQASNGARPADRRIGGACDRNAVYRATGKRMRDLPITAQELLWGARHAAALGYFREQA